MGAFFTNIQVHTGGRPAHEVRGEVIEAVRASALASPFREVAKDESPDRTLVIGPVGPEPWIAVYDELTEVQDMDILTGLARDLSARVDSVTIAILVHDSDILELRLCLRGDEVDAYSSQPDYFETLRTRRGKALLGRPGLWADLLVPGANPEDLRRGWDEKRDFAEETLQSTAELLGLNPERCTTGYNYLAATGQIGSAFVQLRFRSTLPLANRIMFAPAPTGPRETQPTRATYRPLCADDSSLSEYHDLLDALAGRRYLVAMMAFGAERRRAGEAVAEAIEGWNEVIQAEVLLPQGRFLLNDWGRSDEEAKTYRLRPQGLLKGRRWQEIRRSLETSRALYGELVVSDIVQGITGFIFDANPGRFPAAEDAAVPYLALWLDRVLVPKGVAVPTDSVVNLIDEAMLHGEGIQAFLAEWGWVPHGVHSTAYELLCGVRMRCTTGRYWSTRFLRAATPWLWIGPELLALLEDAEQTKRIATVASVGSGLRITLMDPADLPRLERAVEGLLPRRTAWVEAMRRLFPDQKP